MADFLEAHSMYGKIFSSLWHGSLLGQGDVQLVFCLLIAHADVDGDVEAHPAEIATCTGKPLEAVLAALAVLMAPDAESRTPEQDGCRVIRNGLTEWHIVNYKLYRGMRDEHQRREQNRQSQGRRRDTVKSASRQPKSAAGQPLSAYGEGDGEVEEKSQKLLSDRGSDLSERFIANEAKFEKLALELGTPVPIKARRLANRLKEHPLFPAFYKAHPRPEDRIDASKAFDKALKRHEHITAEELAWAAGEYARECREKGKDKEFIKQAARWLNAGSYLEYLEDKSDEEVPSVNGTAV